MSANRVLVQVLYFSLAFFFKCHAVYFNGSDYFPLLKGKGGSLLAQNLGMIFQLCLQKRKFPWCCNKYLMIL